MNNSYRYDSRSYLWRARELLNTGAPAGLFYAAFELRCGIEARMQEYLEVAEDISEKRKEGWQIAKLSKDLERAFKIGDKAMEITVEHPELTEACKIYYTPVSPTLRKQAQQLGDYLHAMKIHRPQTDKWWDSFRELLNATRDELALATKGIMVGPPIVSPDRKHMKTHFENGVYPEIDKALKLIGKVGERAKLAINYLDKFPVSK
jgi:hypothetical protein